MANVPIIVYFVQRLNLVSDVKINNIYEIVSFNNAFYNLHVFYNSRIRIKMGIVINITIFCTSTWQAWQHVQPDLRGRILNVELNERSLSMVFIIIAV